jgi:hypothetical protein
MRAMRRFPTYSDPFSTAQEVHDLARRYLELNAKRPITDEQCLAAGSALLQGIDLRTKLRTVFRWKLESFIPRIPWARTFPDGISDAPMQDAIQAAREATLSDDRTIRHALRTLDGLPHVGIPVASAILMAMHPDHFTVIDRQAYKTLGAEFRDPLPEQEYLHYLGFCRRRAESLGVTLRDYDRALWQSGSDASRSRTCS